MSGSCHEVTSCCLATLHFIAIAVIAVEPAIIYSFVKKVCEQGKRVNASVNKCRSTLEPRLYVKPRRSPILLLYSGPQEKHGREVRMSSLSELALA